MHTILHQADTRGIADHGWLNSHHTFSFGNYHNPDRMGFGLLRVINDDVVQPAMGFGTHPHENMEIISIPLRGELRHQDSMGNTQHISTGEVQIMSAGSGLTHSEYNASSSDAVNFLQIWVLPKELNIEPRYDQKVFLPEGRPNQWQLVVAPDAEGAVWINQAAWFSLGDYVKDTKGSYDLRQSGHGVYLFVIEGAVTVFDQPLERRDGLGISGTDRIEFEASEDCELLIIEVPLT